MRTILFLIGFIGCSITIFAQTNSDSLKEHVVKITSFNFHSSTLSREDLCRFQVCSSHIETDSNAAELEDGDHDRNEDEDEEDDERFSSTAGRKKNKMMR
jgi:hypothetical protein